MSVFRRRHIGADSPEEGPGIQPAAHPMQHHRLARVCRSGVSGAAFPQWLFQRR